ncbi:MAG: metal ABC transporter ATP-binding protein [Synechococcales cyanobacterium RM1_1_8]|nr:metal ABC transporter ATP-binding protein [Synechococcales cyanobacterium RM1_1_8]
MQSENLLLSVEGLSVRRGNMTAVQDVSFSLAAGVDMAIVGPNGAGKSTLVQAILGLLPHHQGEIKWFGQRLHAPSSSSQQRAARLFHQGVAYLPQNFLVDARIPMTVGELVGLGWDRAGLQLPWQGWRDRRRAVHQALDRVEASHLSRQSLGSLSGGELKRVLLAYCLVRPRQLLVLDEAPAGLDFSGEAEFYQLLGKLKREQGWSILQISHDLDMVRENCDCVLCINRRLLKQGAPTDVLHPDTLYEAYGYEAYGQPQLRWRA